MKKLEDIKNLKNVKTLVVANHIYEFFLLTSALKLLSLTPDQKFSMHLLVKPKVASKIPEDFKKLYEEIIVCDFPYNPLFQAKDRTPKEMVRTLYYIFYKQFKDSIVFRKKIQSLKKHNFDLIVISSFREYFANIIMRHLSPVPAIVLAIDNERMESGYRRLRMMTSLVANIFNRIFGYSAMKYRWHNEYKNVMGSRFTKSPYSKTLFIQNSSSGSGIPNPFSPSLFPSTEGSSDTRKKILIVGERAPIGPDWNYKGTKPSIDSISHKKYLEFLDYMRKEFSDCKIYFKPRKEYTDVSTLDLSGFEVIEKEQTLEEIMLQTHYYKIISIKSTASKIGSCFGYPSYSIFPFLQLSPQVSRHFHDFFADSPNVKMVERLEQLKEDITLSVPSVEELAQKYRSAIYETKE
ncbi:MAG: hypothetical protein QG640_183 [Patescibacteria group bacterium]|nr:hypothetical protein [Patescibacteria group bacterium]